MKKVKYIEIRTADDKVILKFHIAEEEILDDDKPEDESDPLEESEKMTDNQKRYLFRIVADRGIQDDEAYEHLKGLFQVSSLKDVTKAAASSMIEFLLENGKGGNGHDRPPF